MPNPRTITEAENMIADAEDAKGTHFGMSYEEGVAAGIAWALRLNEFDGCTKEEDTPL